MSAQPQPSKYQQQIWLMDGFRKSINDSLNLAELHFDFGRTDEGNAKLLAALQDLNRAVRNLDDRLRIEEKSYAE